MLILLSAATAKYEGLSGFVISVKVIFKPTSRHIPVTQWQRKPVAMLECSSYDSLFLFDISKSFSQLICERKK